VECIRIGVIGLDTSHAVEFPRRMQAPDVDPALKVPGLRAASCLRFATPFQDEEQLDGRQRQLEQWGVKVTRRLEEAVEDVDALMLEINDPALHLEYFGRCAGLGLPVFLDKPLADTLANGRKIADLARQRGTRLFSSSSLRFAPAFEDACAAVPAPVLASVYGPLGTAPAGSSVVWYGVHAFEMLQRALGLGAAAVLAKRDALGAAVVVRYPDARRGIVELTGNSLLYGGCLRTLEAARPFAADPGRAYTAQLARVARFFQGGPAPVAMEDTLEVMAMIDAAERSYQSGREEPL
jgi:predicted dehydrogenase